MRTPNGIPIYPGDAADWGFEDGVLTSPTCAAERGMELAMRCARAQLNRDKAEIERKYERRLEKIEEKLTMEGVKDITSASSIGDVKLVEAQMKAKLTGKTVPTALCALFALALSAFGATNEVHYANVNDLTDGKVVTDVVFGDSGVDTNEVKALAGQVTSNVVTKSYVEGLGLETVITPVTVTNISSTVTSNVVTRKYVEDLHIAPPGGISPEDATNIAGRVTSNVVTKTYVTGLGVPDDERVESLITTTVTKEYVEDLGIKTDVDWQGVTNASAKVTSNVVTKAYVEDLGIRAETDWQGVTNASAKVTSNVVTKAYVEGLGIAPPGGVSPQDATNIAGRVTSNVVTKTYVEGLGVHADVDWNAVSNAARTAAREETAGTTKTWINNTIDNGLKVADVTVDGEPRDIYIPGEFPAVPSKGSSADIARRDTGRGVLKSTVSRTGSQAYVELLNPAFWWLPTLSGLWVGGERGADGVVYGAVTLDRLISLRIAQEAPPPEDYDNVARLAKSAIQSLQPAYDYTDSQVSGITETVMNAVTNGIVDLVTNQVIDKAERLVSADGEHAITASGEVLEREPAFVGYGGRYVVTDSGGAHGPPLEYCGAYSMSTYPLAYFNGMILNVTSWTNSSSDSTYDYTRTLSVTEKKAVNSQWRILSTSYEWKISTTRVNRSSGMRSAITKSISTDQSLPSGTIPSDAYYEYPSGPVLTLTLDGTPPARGMRKVGDLSVVGKDGPSVDRIVSADGSLFATPTSLFTNVDVSAMGYLDVYYVGRKLNGRLVPSMQGTTSVDAWHWTYTGDDTDKLTDLYFLGDSYKKYPNDDTIVYSTVWYAKGTLPYSIGIPSDGMVITYCSGRDPIDEPSPSPMSKDPGFEFVFHIGGRIDSPEKIDDFALKSVEDSRVTEQITKGGGIIRGDGSTSFVENDRIDRIVFLGHEYNREPDEVVVSIYGSWPAWKWSSTEVVDYFVNISGEPPTSKYSWYYVPNGRPDIIDSSDRYRDARVEAFAGHSVDQTMATSLSVTMYEEYKDSYGKWHTTSVSRVASRLIPSTNDTGKVLTSSSNVFPLRADGFIELEDGTRASLDYIAPYPGDSVEADGYVFTYDPSQDKDESSNKYRYYVNPDLAGQFRFKLYYESYGGVREWRWSADRKSGSDWCGSDPLDILESSGTNSAFGMSFGWFSSGFRKPSDPTGSSYRYTVSRTPRPVTNVVDRVALRSTLPSVSFESGIGCTNTQQNKMGVIRATYDGSNVQFIWSER